MQYSIFTFLVTLTIVSGIMAWEKERSLLIAVLLFFFVILAAACLYVLASTALPKVYIDEPEELDDEQRQDD